MQYQTQPIGGSRSMCITTHRSVGESMSANTGGGVGTGTEKAPL